MPGIETTASYSHGGSARPLLGETIGANLARAAAAFPDAEALVECETRPALELPPARRTRSTRWRWV